MKDLGSKNKGLLLYSLWAIISLIVLYLLNVLFRCNASIILLPDIVLLLTLGFCTVRLYKFSIPTAVLFTLITAAAAGYVYILVIFSQCGV